MATKQKILIVDDDSNIAELISLYLTKEFYEVQIVEDGEQALQVFASRHGRLSGLQGDPQTFQHADHHALS